MLIEPSCLDCDKLKVVQLEELAHYNLSLFKRPEIINPYKHKYACSIDSIQCSDKCWHCEEFVKNNWEIQVTKQEKLEESLKLSDKNFNNVSEELQNLSMR